MDDNAATLTLYYIKVIDLTNLSTNLYTGYQLTNLILYVT